LREWTSQEKDVLALLADLSPYLSPFGGARSLEESHVSTAQYGPAGHAQPGQQHRDGLNAGGLKMLRASLRLMAVALALLRREDFDAWASLIPRYLGDPADPGGIEYDRARVRELDEENARRREKKRPEKVALVTARTQLDRHDRAISKLAEILEGHTLHPTPTRIMTQREHEAGEKANASMNAEVDRLMALGAREEVAIGRVAKAWGVSTGAVERVREFRSVLIAPECCEEDCEEPAFAGGKCRKHYQRDYRKRKVD